MLESLPAIAVLVVAGIVVIAAQYEVVLLAALALHSLALAVIAGIGAGWAISASLLTANATAIAVMALSAIYRADQTQDWANISRQARVLWRRPPRRFGDWQRQPSLLLRVLSALLAVAIALGLSDKPIGGGSEALRGMPAFVGYWLLAAAVIVFLLGRDYLKVGAGVVIMVNAGQMMYLMLATNLETSLIAGSMAVLIALSLGVSFLAVTAARLAASTGPEPNQVLSAEPGLEADEARVTNEGARC